MRFLKSKLFALKQVSLRVVDGCMALPRAIVQRNGVISYWGFNNFGDLLTPFFLKELGFTPIHAPRVSFAKFVCVGSILDSINEGFSGAILGSGFLNDKRPKKLPNATVLAVRGKLTKQLLGLDGDIQLGDSGLILSKLIHKRPEKKYKLGVVPHYSDKEDIRVQSFIKEYSEDVLFIDVYQDPVAVFNQIAMCEHIASSSLHGLVLADSLGIPNLWLSFSNLLGNGTFKFDDYYSAFDEERAPYVPTGKESSEKLISLMKLPPKKVPEVSEGVYQQLIAWKQNKR